MALNETDKKRYRGEKEKLKSQLEEETDFRKKIQAEAQKLVGDIKTACAAKISKLKEDLKVQQDVIANKQTIINDMDNYVKQLQDDVRRLTSEAKICKEEAKICKEEAKIKEVHGALDTSKHVRESISMMESRLNQKSNELEDRIKQMQDIHTDELFTKAKEYEQVLNNLKKLLNEKDSQLEEIKGRLEESRNARDSTLQDMKQSHQRYLQSIEDLESKFDEAQSQLNRLQMTRDRDNEAIQEVEGLKQKLNNTMKLNEELTARFNDKVKESDEKTRKVERLETNLKLLKEASSLLDCQLTDLVSTLNCKMDQLKNSENTRVELSEEVSTLKEALRSTRVQLNEAKSIKTFLQKRVEGLEDSVKSSDTAVTKELEYLRLTVEELRQENEKLDTLLHSMTLELESTKEEKESLFKMISSNKEEIKRLNKEIVQMINAIVDLKDSNMKLKSGLEVSIEKAESYKSQLETLSNDCVLKELVRYEQEVKMQSTIEQQSKLIEHLQNQNESLAKKEKKFALFSRTPKVHPMTPNSKTNCFSTPQKNTPMMTPSSKQTPIRLIQEHQAMRNLEEKAASLKQKLAVLQEADVKVQKAPAGSDKLELFIDEGGSGSLIRKSIILQDDTKRLDINCVLVVSKDLYLLGCDDGLYSRKGFGASSPDAKVKMGLVEAVYQIELIPTLKSVLMIEGPNRRLAIANMRLVKCSAEAASCSQPKIHLSSVADIINCLIFAFIETEDRNVYLAVATQKHLYILSWDGDNFILLKRINVRETVTCMLMTPNSVIFGSDRVYELDIKNFQLDEFIDTSDETLYYIGFSCDMLTNFPVSILDVGMSNYTPINGLYTKEFLLCFSDLGVFVDAYGRRTREEDIIWSKHPISITYRHPNLFLFHFSSLEIIKLSDVSYTRKPGMASRNSIGKGCSIIPESHFVTLSSPRLLGFGGKTASVIVSSIDKLKTEILEMDLDPRAS